MATTKKSSSKKRAAKAALLTKGEVAEVIEILSSRRDALFGPFMSESDLSHYKLLGSIQGKLRKMAG